MFKSYYMENGQGRLIGSFGNENVARTCAIQWNKTHGHAVYVEECVTVFELADRERQHLPEASKSFGSILGGNDASLKD